MIQMVKLNKIYTRTGDSGTTGLVDGTRRLKSDLRFEACGTIDEANAAIGLVLLHLNKEEGRLEQFPKSVKRFSDKNCGKNKELEQFVEPSETKTALGADNGGGGNDKGSEWEADDGDLSRLLRHVQHDLFDLGADLATPVFENQEKEQAALRIIAAQVTFLEQEIDRMNASLSPLRSFILPGGGAVASYLHLARTFVRRAERVMVALHQQEELNPHALCYVNRLSDMLFVAARVANRGGLDDILWVPGKNR